nr:zinc finger, CCHC-type [Tanacetum cinerariifolium]
FANCSPVYTPVDPTVKFRYNKGTLVSQLEYSRAIGCLMYAMISTTPDIAFAVGKLSRMSSKLISSLWAVKALLRLCVSNCGSMIGYWIVVGTIDPYLGGAARRRACSHAAYTYAALC